MIKNICQPITRDALFLSLSLFFVGVVGGGGEGSNPRVSQKLVNCSFAEFSSLLAIGPLSAPTPPKAGRGKPLCAFV